VTSPFRALRAAFVFLTRIPVGGSPYTPDEWRWSPAFFPIAGAVVGAAVGLVFEALRPLGATGAAYLALGASLLLTGALHEDGLADTSDALGGGAGPEKVFAILKDSRIGVFGGCALVVSIAGRASLLSHVERHAVWALALVGAVARAATVCQLVALPYVTPEGSKSPNITRAGGAQALVALVWTVAIAAGLIGAHRIDPSRVAAALALSALVAIITSWRFKARVGGLTGDFLGATEQLCELASLAAIVWEPR
jgi:adenosylcobinamide-GDP ribazoletransferase